MPADPLIGRQLANYKIERVIGRGGMAQVYYGRDVKLERPIALKLLDARYRDNPTYAKRFVREAQTVSTWRHENILQVYYADEQDGLYFFVMEYIDGPDLGTLLADYAHGGQRMPHDQVVRIGRAIASALDYAHRKGVIHRDVKPANVMIAQDGRVVLADFGLALDVQQGTIGEAFGSAHYIAPEQAHNSSNAVPQSDLYSLGVILYEILTGVVPFDDPSPISVSLQHLTAPPPPPRTLNPDLNAETEAVLLRALSKSPQDRYPTGHKLMDALEHALCAQSLPPAPLAPSSRPAARKSPPWLWLALVGGMVLVALAITVMLAMIGQYSKSPDTSSPPVSTRPATITIKQGSEPSDTSPLPTATRPAAIAGKPEQRVYLPLVLCNFLLPGTAVSQPAPIQTPTLPASPLATPTALPLTGRRFSIYYNSGGLYVLNASGQDSQIAPLAFERIEAPKNRFDGWQWSRYYSLIKSGGCVRAEIRGETIHRPAECKIYHSQITAAPDDDFVFWTAREGSQQFRVLWNEVEVGRCEIAAGMCQVVLP